GKEFAILSPLPLTHASMIVVGDSGACESFCSIMPSTHQEDDRASPRIGAGWSLERWDVSVKWDVKGPVSLRRHRPSPLSRPRSDGTARAGEAERIGFPVH